MGYERDTESGLDFAQARYYHSRHGRFTSPDPLTASATIRDPQSFNRYSYALNSPYKFTDPLGLLSQYTTGANGRNSDAYGIGGASGAFSSALSGFHQNEESDEAYVEVGEFVATSTIVADPQQQQPAPGGNFPCPPTGEELTNNPYVDQAFQAANRYARSAGKRGFVEAGGWILMDRKGNLKYFIKPREDGDTSILVNGLGEPHKYIPNYSSGGDIVIADFHTHVNELPNPGEVGIAHARGTPGIWVYPSGKAEAYGPNRGLLGRALPKACK